jgi:hypothetical protein
MDSLAARPERQAEPKRTSDSLTAINQAAEKPPAVAANSELAPPPAVIEPAQPARRQRQVCIAIEISGGQSLSGEPTVVLRKSIARADGASIVVVMPAAAPSRFHHASGLALRNQLLDEAAPECPPSYPAPAPSASVARAGKTKTFVFLPKTILVIESYPFFLCQTQHRLIIITSATWKDMGLPPLDARD